MTKDKLPEIPTYTVRLVVTGVQAWSEEEAIDNVAKMAFSCVPLDWTVELEKEEA